MTIHNPVKNFEHMWVTFHNRYPFFKLRKVDWKNQYDIYRPKVTRQTSQDELFDIFCQMLDPLDDGHVELKAKIKGSRKRRYFNPESKPKFHQEFSKRELKQLFKTTEKTLVDRGFGQPEVKLSGVLNYRRSRAFGYIRIFELEDVKKNKLTSALNKIARDFDDLDGMIIDIRNNPGGDDDPAIKIINRFCDRKRIAFHRKTKVGPGEEDFTRLKTWHLRPQGKTQFNGPIVLLTCDSVFSGGEVFALAMKELPHVTVIGDHTNGIFSYQLKKKLPNGWRYWLSYQMYFSADMVCYEGKGVPVDIELLNKKGDIESGTDPLITCALKVLKSKSSAISTTAEMPAVRSTFRQ